MSQKNFQIFRSQISDLKTDNVDYLKKPPWKNFFFDIFAIHLTSRYEKRCRMLQRLFSLFQGSKNQLWYTIYIQNFWPKRYLLGFNLYSELDTHLHMTLKFAFFSGLYTPSTINTDYIFWQLQLTVAKSPVKFRLN